jgi:hypothetical protein
MPWLTIIIWIISYLISYSKTKDAGKSALIATGAGALAYYTIEPTNEDAIWGDVTRDVFGMDEEDKLPAVDPTTVPTSGQRTSPVIRAPSNAWDFGGKVVDAAAGTAQSWGPLGTLGVVAGTTALTSSSATKNWWVWALVGLGIYAVAK